MAERSATVRVLAQDLDPVRIDIEADLPAGDLHRSPHRYPVMPVADGDCVPTSDVQDITGRPARDFRDYVKAVAALGIWSAGQD